ncbi:MAG TPA: M20/M25/M40 family metallo-hydrolase [Candidatus Thalassarchaeaceae archaeon]|nr:M20/M25/M40 family metallo-hydrolase [Candidatus Thalassarchaeaceae archaeon]
MPPRTGATMLIIILMMFAPLSGCFGNDDDGPSSDDLGVGVLNLQGGVFQNVLFTANSEMSVYIPYLIQDQATGFIQNSTVIDLENGESKEIRLLAPPRTNLGLFMIGDLGRQEWPVREMNESWATWYNRGGDLGGGNGITRIAVDGNGSFDSVNHSASDGGVVSVQTISIVRQQMASYEVSEGAMHSTGLVSGRGSYNFLHTITDGTAESSSWDGVSGFYDRWAGQGNLAYEEAAQWIHLTLESYGLEVMNHRFEFTDIFDIQNPESYNVCGYSWGTVYPDEWLVFGAHFDIAPPANAAMPFLDPHVIGERTYGTRVGAYDNTAGTSMVLETARALVEFDTRRTMVFCLWSGEEGGKRGSTYWTEEYVVEDNPDVTIVDYINLDMAGVNWPGGGGAPHGDPEPEIDSDGYPKDSEIWPMRVYIGPSANHETFDQAEMIGLANWIGSDAMGLEEQMGNLIGTGLDEETWKTDAWLETDRPEIIVYEDTTARSDHASFQAIGTTTIGFGGLVDGYWCYHQTCDTLEEMESWMDTTGKNYGEENTGTANLVNSLDMITWWAAYSFFHMDEKPVLNPI